MNSRQANINENVELVASETNKKVRFKFFIVLHLVLIVFRLINYLNKTNTTLLNNISID